MRHDSVRSPHAKSPERWLRRPWLPPLLALGLAPLLCAPAQALKFDWSFVSEPPYDNPGEVIRGTIDGLVEGINDAQGVTVTVDETPTGELLGVEWRLFSYSRFIVTDGQVTFANALYNGNFQGGLQPYLAFGLNGIGIPHPFLWGREPGRDWVSWSNVTDPMVFLPHQEPIAVPSPLPLFGAAATFGMSRRLRRRIQRSG